MENETFIRMYENAIPHELCDKLIKKFDDNPDQWKKRDKRTDDSWSNDRGNLIFNELFCFNYMDTWKEEMQAVADVFSHHTDKYIREFDQHCFPLKYGIEPFKMKKYEPNGIDEFGWHVDVLAKNSMHRWLGFFLYLSDNEEVKTEFQYQSIITDCKKGSMVIFPPMWPWFHRGTKPIKEPKYFMGSYLHYIE